MQNNIGSIIFPNEWGIGHEPAINISTALVWINPSGSATRNPGRNRMGRFVGSLTILKGFVANWQGEEGDPRQLSQGRPDTIELTGVVYQILQKGYPSPSYGRMGISAEFVNRHKI